MYVNSNREWYKLSLLCNHKVLAKPFCYFCFLYNLKSASSLFELPMFKVFPEICKQTDTQTHNMITIPFGLHFAASVIIADNTWLYIHIHVIIIILLRLYYNYTRLFSIKMKEDVGRSKPKKHVNKVGRLTYNVGSKIKQTTSI